MEKQSPTKKSPTKSYRPLLSVEPVVKVVSRKFEIKESAADLISQYAKFLSEESRQPVKEDAVVESLAKLILGDKGFGAWAKNLGNSKLHKEGG